MFIAAIIILKFIYSSVVHIYDFQIFTVIYLPLHGFIATYASITQLISSVDRALHQYHWGYGYDDGIGMTMKSIMLSRFLSLERHFRGRKKTLASTKFPPSRLGTCNSQPTLDPSPTLFYICLIWPLHSDLMCNWKSLLTLRVLEPKWMQ